MYLCYKISISWSMFLSNLGWKEPIDIKIIDWWFSYTGWGYTREFSLDMQSPWLLWKLKYLYLWCIYFWRCVSYIAKICSFIDSGPFLSVASYTVACCLHWVHNLWQRDKTKTDQRTVFFPYKKPLMLIHISWPQYIISIWRRELGGVPNMTLGKSLQIRQRQSS